MEPSWNVLPAWCLSTLQLIFQIDNLTATAAKPTFAPKLVIVEGNIRFFVLAHFHYTTVIVVSDTQKLYTCRPYTHAHESVDGQIEQYETAHIFYPNMTFRSYMLFIVLERPPSVELWRNAWTLNCFSNPWCVAPSNFSNWHEIAPKEPTNEPTAYSQIFMHSFKVTHTSSNSIRIQVENPFLEKFYGNPKRYAFPMQIWFLRQRFGTYLRAIRMLFDNEGEKPVKGIIMDRSVCITA